MNDPRGSLWRKWDLHFHTPSSFDYQNKGITNVAIIDGLKKAGIGAVAITDHHFMDFARILELKELAGEDITIFPGIEFRSELGGKDSIHFIGIFPEDCDPEHVWLQIQVPLKLTRKDIEARGGDDAIYVKMEEAAAIVHKNNGLISVHAGKKSNSIEIIRNSDL
jgi:exonuclease SbcC